jgi:hypothetical protein
MGMPPQDEAFAGEVAGEWRHDEGVEVGEGERQKSRQLSPRVAPLSASSASMLSAA